MARRIDLLSPRIRPVSLTALVVGLGLAALAGCEEHVGQPSAPPPEPSHTVVEGAGSAPGKALESGHKLQDKVNEHNKELEKQIEDINKN